VQHERKQIQATKAQKLQLLNVLYGYVKGQLNGALSSLEDADSESAADGYARDGADILQCAIDFAEHSDMNKLLSDVNEHDTLVREDVYELMKEADEELLAVLRTLENCYYEL